MTPPLGLPGPIEILVTILWIAAFVLVAIVARQFLRARERERD